MEETGKGIVRKWNSIEIYAVIAYLNNGVSYTQV